MKLRDHVEKSVRNYLKDLNGEEASGMYRMVIDEVEKTLIQEVMIHAERNQSKAARLLGIDRNTLRKKLLLHGLHE